MVDSKGNYEFDLGVKGLNKTCIQHLKVKLESETNITPTTPYFYLRNLLDIVCIGILYYLPTRHFALCKIILQKLPC